MIRQDLKLVQGNAPEATIEIFVEDSDGLHYYALAADSDLRLYVKHRADDANADAIVTYTSGLGGIAIDLSNPDKPKAICQVTSEATAEEGSFAFRLDLIENGNTDPTTLVHGEWLVEGA